MVEQDNRAIKVVVRSSGGDANGFVGVPASPPPNTTASQVSIAAMISSPSGIYSQATIIGLDRWLGGTLQCSYAATGDFPNRPGLPSRVRRHYLCHV
jgi:hypothetical protein